MASKERMEKEWKASRGRGRNEESYYQGILLGIYELSRQHGGNIQTTAFSYYF